MTNQTQDNLCQEVEERIAEVVRGDAEPRLLEHIAGCDRCRDLRFDADAVVVALEQAGADYVHPDDFEQKLAERLAQEAIEPSGPPVTATVVDVAPVPAGPDGSPAVPAGPDGSPPVPGGPEPKTQPMDAAAQPEATSIEPVAASPNVESVTASPKAEPVAAAPIQPATKASTSKGIGGGSAKVIGLTIVAAASLAAAAGIALWVRSTGDTDKTTAAEAWTATVSSVKVAGKDDSGGLQQCQPDGSSCKPVTEGAKVTAGSLLRTDQRTRVHLEMSDGTRLALDRATELTLGEQAGRLAGIRSGAIVADVAHLDEGPGAQFDLPIGKVEVLGTKFTLTVTEDRSAVEVVRGSVRLSNNGGESVVVRAGEEGTLEKDANPSVMPASSLGESLAWSERNDVEDGPDDALVRGLGELRARKPGSKGELNQAVRLTKHDVKVRVSGQIARTEIDETFSNDTGEVLEGIYRFPLPPDAQIERLALEVDGKMEEGSFVDKDRAAAIWRGVIHAAAPKSPKPREEIVWVPGPWRDPALLEWQRGGRFELKIYPIPAKGSRRVVLAYTQRVQRSGGVRKYTYPLSYDPSGSTRVESFNVDVQVRGHDKAFGVRSRGYEFESGGDQDAKHMTMNAKSFVPSGDISIEYAMPQDEREVTAWAYKAEPKAVDTNDEENDKGEPAKPVGDVQPPSTDEDAYVAIALRPKLPRWSEGKFRDQVIVVDVSRSMVGERFKRAAVLAERVVREMDRRDRFAVLACDTKCTQMDETMRAPGGAAAQQVRAFLDGIEPDGGSDLVEAVRQARKFADKDADARELRVVYIGDGTPSVGPVRPPHIMQEVGRVLPPGSGALTAVAVGADADNHALSAMARGGGGVMIPFVPGEQTGAVAMRVLGASYGIALRNPVVDLPEGLTAVYPKMIDNIPAGGETIIVARMHRSVDKGDIKLHGKVGGEKYEQTYPIELSVSSAKGNAFVPRLYAATKIDDLEATQGDSAKSELVELSKRFAVASRYTSLLVLESAAMFRAFGIDRNTSGAPLWTGEEESESSGSDGLTRYKDAEEEDEGGFALGSIGAGNKKEAKPKAGGKSARGYGGPAADVASEYAAPPGYAPPAPAATATMAPPRSRPPTKSLPDFDDRDRVRRDPGRGMVPMRRVWDRKARIDADTSAAIERASKAISEMEREVSDNPDSRTRLEKLLGLYAVTGQVDRASELAERWAKRDALDPGALVARAENAARRGDRANAIRILGGLADVRPGDPDTQKWLAGLHEAAGEDYLACSHRIALAGLRMKDAKVVVDAVRCAQNTQRGLLGSTLRSDVTEASVRSAVDRELAKTPKEARLRGDVRIEATWDDDVDLDVALIGRKGQRYAWLGDPKGRVSAQDATSTRRETIAVFNAPRGDYVVEVTRADMARSDAPVRGSLKIRAAGTTKVIPFVLSGARTDAGRVRIFYTSHLEPVRGW
jgi:Vault protein inter-alpha-trypsin domain/FecR protein/von Willebrand factor type A domain